jgi:hypothetical protein
MTSNSGASAAAVSSKRTWSLPLPVGPVATASAFSSSRDIDHALGDQGTRDRSAEIVLPLVNRSRLEHRENEVARELLAQIVDVALARAGAQRLVFEAVEFLLLADIRAKGDNLRGIGFLQPGEQKTEGIPALRSMRRTIFIEGGGLSMPRSATE